MRRNLKNPRFISVLVFLCFIGLLHSDGNPFPDHREAHESFLLDLGKSIGKYGRSAMPESQDHFPDQEMQPEARVDAPGYAGYRDYIMTMDPETRRIPENALFKAARHVGEEIRRGRLKSADSYSWEEIASNTGGRTRMIMYDPNDPDHEKVWAGAITGGLWYRNNIRGTDAWKPVDDFWPGLAVSCMAYDPNNTGIFYVGTGEGQTAVTIYRESSGRGSGIWKSADAGTNWEMLPATAGFEYLTDIAVRNESGKSVIYAGVSSGIYKGKIHTSEPNEGLFRSDDGGESWAQVLPHIPGTGVPFSPAHIEISTGNRMFVGTMRNVFQQGGGRILYSDNGVNWTVIDNYVSQIEIRRRYNIPGRVILASAPSDPERIYAIIAGGDSDPASGFVYSRGVFILKSIDAGASWSKVTMPPPREGESYGQWSFLAWHALTAAVQPDDPDVLWVGGLDLYRSDDAGMTWSRKSLWWNFGRNYRADYPIYVHADQHSLIFRPGSSTELLNSNDGGVFITTDAKSAYPLFEEKNQSYNTLQHYACAIHPVAGKRYFFGACQDNGTFLVTTLPTSKENSVSYGDGAFCFIDEDEPDYQITGSQFNYFYYSSDGRHSDVRRFNFAGGTFINPVDYDYIDNVLYANGMSFEGAFRDTIFRIRRVNDTLLSAAAIPSNTGSAVPFSAMHVLSRKMEGNTIVFAGSQSGRLYRLDNAQAEIISAEIGGQEFPAGYISCIQTGENADRILVTFSNYGVSHVFETLNGGITWEDKTGNLPDMPVRWAIYPPGTSDHVMLATELGVWYTTDITAGEVHWVKSGEPFPNVRVDMLRSRKSDMNILAATHGRGLWLSSGVNEVSSRPYASPEGHMKIYPNPASGFLQMELGNHWTGRVRIGIYDQAGRLVRDLVLNSADEKIGLGGIAPGSYVLGVEAGKDNYSQTFIKIE